MKNFIRLFFTFLILFFISSPSTIHAGGGTYEFVNFDSKGIYRGLSKELIIRVHDANVATSPANSVADYPVVRDKEFRFVAHRDLNGAFCNPEVIRSDSQGLIKATCGAGVNGRFVFHVEPVNQPNIPTLGPVELFLQGGSADPTAKPAVSTPKPTSFATVTPTSAPVEKIETPEQEQSATQPAELETPTLEPETEVIENAKPQSFLQRLIKTISRWIFFWQQN